MRLAPRTRYDGVAMLIHWLTAVLMIYMVFFGEDLMKSGEIDKIYAKWFTSPIPPKNINMNFPETPAIKEAFKNPNDKGVE